MGTKKSSLTLVVRTLLPLLVVIAEKKLFITIKILGISRARRVVDIETTFVNNFAQVEVGHVGYTTPMVLLVRSYTASIYVTGSNP